MIQLDRKQQLVILLLVGVILFGGGYRLAQIKEQARNKAMPALESAGDMQDKKLYVHVAGAVEKPGVYQLPRGSRVIEAVKMAEPTGDADLDSLNLASVITDGQKIYVPLKPTAFQDVTAGPGITSGVPVSQPAGVRRNTFISTAGVNSAGVASPAGLININTADQSLLETLPGIGPTLAQRIIQYREINGRFDNIEDLKNVSGIGDKKFESLRDMITVR